MFAGFDFGTSNCAIGTLDKNSVVKLVALEGDRAYLPSTLYALERELICDYVAHHIPRDAEQEDYINHRKPLLAQAQRVRNEYDIDRSEQVVFVGNEAFDQYQSMPDEGYFIKSPKSFLGASGLRPEFIQFFEDIITAMMVSIKQRAEQRLGYSIEQTVIGRPVNFQGLQAEQSNRQAIDILSLSAKRAGFKAVEFIYEPLAAGFDFEERLNENKTVLVVDIGGGTSDCAMLTMGPAYRNKRDRSADLLGHSGERIGGNDFDIQLAGKALMPLFGMKSLLKNGLPMPSSYFFDAVATNDAGAQARFASLATTESLKRLLLDTTEPALLKRFLLLRDEKLNYQLVKSAEQAKIALSESQQIKVPLAYIEDLLSCDVSEIQLEQAITQPLTSIVSLMHETIKQAGKLPDVVYVTGGSAKSPLLRAAIKQAMGDIDIVDGDHFGSVAAGLTLWAKRLYQ